MASSGKSSFDKVGYEFISDTPTNFSVCYAANITRSDSLITYDDSLNELLPLLYLQLLLIMFISRVIFIFIKPLHQPRFVAEIMGAIVLGFSGIGQSQKFLKAVFPFNSLKVLETLANLSLVYHVFIIGLESDISMIFRTGKKALGITISSIIAPAAVGFGLYFLIEVRRPEIDSKGAIFWALTLTVTSFPDLARVLADQKLLYTDIGRRAISSGVVNDFFTWVFLTFSVSVINNGIILALIICVIFSLTCFYLVRPSIMWLIRNTSKGEIYKDHHLSFVVAGVSLFAFASDALGMQPFIGAFAFGLMIPSGEMKRMLLERLHDMVSGILLPLYFLSLALKLKFKFLLTDISPGILATIIVSACLIKVVSTFLISMCQRMSAQESLALGLLGNTKGVLAIIILEAARDLQVLDFQTYGIMMIVILAMTAIVGPLIAITKKPTKCFTEFKTRNIQKMKPNEELRVLVAIHSTRDVMGTINLLEASNATKQSPINVFAVHLVELTARASAMLIVHDTCGRGGENSSTRSKSESDNIFSAFESYERSRSVVSATLLTAVSPYTTMHEDICSLAEDKGVVLVILPFHKQATADGRMEDNNPAHRAMNVNVLDNARCSVGIFVDRRLGLPSRVEPGSRMLQFVMFFFGGPDDREALAYAWRMAGHHDIYLTVVRFEPGKNVVLMEEDDLPDDVYEKEKQLQRDARLINQFKFSAMEEKNISYLEKVVDNGEETLAAIRGLEQSFDMYIVGRRQTVLPALTSGLSDWNECPELGALGDTLVASDFAMHASVLVVQYYSSPGMYEALESTGPSAPQAAVKAKDHMSARWDAPHMNNESHVGI